MDKQGQIWKYFFICDDETKAMYILYCVCIRFVFGQILPHLFIFGRIVKIPYYSVQPQSKHVWTICYISTQKTKEQPTHTPNTHTPIPTTHTQHTHPHPHTLQWQPDYTNWKAIENKVPLYTKTNFISESAASSYVTSPS